MISIKDGKLYQWDTGRIVMCKAPEGMWIDEIHLDNYTTKNAIILKTYLDGDYVCAKIPDVVLQKLNPINIYTVMRVENDEKTIESSQFNVIQRKKPEDYVYEEEEILRYDNLEEKIEELEEKIENFEPGGGGGGGNVEITAKSIKEALGYVPADEEEVDKLSQEIDNHVIDAWMESTGNQIEKPFEKINKLSPTITFIDDDTMRYDAVKRYHNIFSNFGKGKNLYDKTARVDGYTIHSQSGANYADASYSVSDYIPVDGNTQYTFSRNGVIAPTWLLSIIAFYDNGKNFISISNSKDSFTTPEGTAYLRFATSTVRMEGSVEEGYIQLEKGSVATPYEEYSNGSYDIKGCYGVITDYLERDENLKNLLLRYEDEGFGMLFHAKWQDVYYMDNDKRDIALAEADYCQGMRKMRDIGFIDYNYWVSPYGVTDEEIVSMCKRHGAKCLLSTYNNTFIQNNGLNGKSESVERYAMPRCSLGYDDSQYPKFTLADLKLQIDKCVQANGWLIITTHVQQWSDEYGETPDNRLREIIQYAIDNNCKIKTFSEAYAERNSVLMVNDIC